MTQPDRAATRSGRMQLVTDSREHHRLAGVDVARALALIGMLMVHFGPKGETDILGRLYALPHGRASVLFVLVAGVGIALLSSSPEKHADARLRLLCFALFLLPLGLLLEGLRHPVAIILHHYAVFFLLGIAAMGLSKRWLGVLAAAWTLIGPLIFYAGMMVAPSAFDRESAELGGSIVSIVSALLFTGPYPLLVWGAPLLWGLWIGRHDLRDRRLRWAMMGIGVGLAAWTYVASELLFAWVGEPGETPDWRFVFAHSAHSEMPLWIIGALGSAIFVLGGVLELADRFPRVAAPLAALGQMALTIYVVQILVLTAAAPLVHQDAVLPAIVSVVTFTLLTTLYAMAWRQTVGRGPVEQLMHALWLWADGLRTAQSASLRP
jgi:uncharacterized membrane protein YeiB